MKNFILLAIILLVGGCAYQMPYEIAQPPGPSYTVVAAAGSPVVTEAEPPIVVSPSGQPSVKIWRPDPTQGLICNYSKTITLDGLWVDSRPPAPPTLRELAPEVCQPFYLFLGDHYLYAEGSVDFPVYGKTSVGTARREFSIRNWSWGYGYAWRLYIGDGDFIR